MARAATICALMLCGLMTMGADGCPFGGQAPAAAAAPRGDVLDVGGSAGALWDIRYAGDLAVTLRSGKQVAGAPVADQRQGPVLLLGQTIDVTSFCFRPDVACPQHVLPAEAAIAQPGEDPADVLLAFNRRGPLARVRVAGIPGRLDGAELSFSLATVEQPGDPCNLRQPSAVLATAQQAEQPADASAGDGGLVAGALAERIAGRVTVAYGGVCLAVGGSGSVDAEAVVELAASFSATRAGASAE